MNNDLAEDLILSKASEILGFHNDSHHPLDSTGQDTTFNTLGKYLDGQPWRGNNKKPDGWYLPKLKTKPAIILECKKPSVKLLTKYNINELTGHMKIALEYYQDVMGILYNGNEVYTYRNESTGSKTIVQAQLAKTLQNKDYYLKVFTDKPVNVQEIYKLTARINNNLHFNFDVRSLYDRMLLTAGALVAVRYGANFNLNTSYKLLSKNIVDTLEDHLEQSQLQSMKVSEVINVFKSIKIDGDPSQKDINNFIIDINKISKSVNSSHWRGEDVMAIFFNEFNRYKSKSDNGQIFTPQHIANFMYRLINVGQDDSVLDATCGSGTFLTVAMSNMITEAGGPNTDKAKEIKQHQLYGIEFDKTIFTLACANMLIHKDGKTNLLRKNTMSKEAIKWIHNISWLDPGDERKDVTYLKQNRNNLKPYHITKVLMNPPYERKYKPIDILNDVLDNVPKGTDAAILLPDRKLETSGKKKVRNLLKNNHLLKIIKLPDKTFNEGVSVSIFIFKTGEPTTKKSKIFCCEIKDDGLETVKNQGRQDVKHRWPAIEDKWVDIIQRMDKGEKKDKSRQWITPDVENRENLSFPIPQKPFTISDEDFMKTVMDYEMFKEGIDPEKIKKNVQEKVLYQDKEGEKNGKN